MGGDKIILKIILKVIMINNRMRAELITRELLIRGVDGRVGGVS